MPAKTGASTKKVDKKKAGTESNQSDRLKLLASGTSLIILCLSAYISRTIQYIMKSANSKSIKLDTNHT